MKKVVWTLIAAITISGASMGPVRAEQFTICPTDIKVRQKMCALYLRYGKDALARLKFDDARAHFKRAIQADPGSRVAWAYYNQALVLSLAWRFKVKGYMFGPETPVRTLTPSGKKPPPKPAAKPAKKPAAKPAKKPAGPAIPPPPPDEGC